ncbi:hypothetical protein HELRODRAFT_172625 [Helobdella robusta]|uniref:Uncharacterized protein n=1 Tax=Helobdella robusta TaxID=6412 RepID=T1F5N6_HELRO|nr:hypothetical protein HELRODRAFT_172625 [Helobdella robusta]ESO04268.1 hypothetical protein HELRODRAFT_172625 [Helobdella robusta]
MPTLPFPIPPHHLHHDQGYQGGTNFVTEFFIKKSLKIISAFEDHLRFPREEVSYSKEQHFLCPLIDPTEHQITYSSQVIELFLNIMRCNVPIDQMFLPDNCKWNIINSDNPNNNINNINNNNSINNNNNNSANTVDTNATTHSANITCKWNIITRSKKNHSDDNNNANFYK